MEFLQSTRGSQHVGSIWLSSELILTKTYCDKKSIYQSTTICHNAPRLSHGHFNVHYVLVFSEVFSIYLTGIWLHFPPETIILTMILASFYSSKDRSLPYSNFWLGSASHWVDSALGKNLLHSQFLKCPLPLLRKAGHSSYILSLAESTKFGCLIQWCPICRSISVLWNNLASELYPMKKKISNNTDKTF